MSVPFNEENLMKAFFKSVAATGIGAFSVVDLDKLKENVLQTIPSSMQNEFPINLLEAVMLICGNAPYSWGVKHRKLKIKEDYTFEDVYNKWFRKILTPELT